MRRVSGASWQCVLEAQARRLQLWRLGCSGACGIAAGALATELGASPATLSFHLKELRNARLLRSEREGRSIRYAPDFDVIQDLMGYLGDNCCRDSAGDADIATDLDH